MREQLAAEAEMSPHRVFSNEILLEMAELHPHTEAELAAILGFQRAHHQSDFSTKILAVIGKDQAEAFEERLEDREGDGDGHHEAVP